MIEEFWKNKSKIKTQEIWKWQVNELLKLKKRYGDSILESQLRESINKGWNSIEVSKYENSIILKIILLNILKDLKRGLKI